MSLFNSAIKGIGAFRDSWVNADPMQPQRMVGEFDAYSRWEARQGRYDFFWAAWQANVFRELAHSWAPAVKANYGLYQHTRNIFSPANRCVEFAVNHIVGGHLDTDAGDGEEVRSAIPIQTDNEAIRPAIANLWRDSKWQSKKSIWTRYGTSMGDVGIIVYDDPIRKRVTKRVLHPGHIKWVEYDSAGTVTSYILEQWRYDPRAPLVQNLNPTLDPRSTRRMVKYNEEAFIENGRVTYRTYLDGALFNWRGFTGDGAEMPAEWKADYSFIPLVITPHIDIGIAWGVSELHAMISKTFEVEDMASGLGDQIRKRIRAPKLLAGMSVPKGPPFPAPTDPTINALGSEKGREQLPFLFGPENAKVYDLTNDLDVPGVSTHIQSIISEIERDYPELQMDIWATGDPSGRALRVARQRTENKIQERRVGYDAAEVMSNKFALAIGGLRGYPGYEGFANADPFEAGPLDHEIAHRAVFSPDPLDDIEEGQAFWTMVGSAVTAGMPLELILEREGWEAADIDKIVKAKDEAAAKAQDQALQLKTTAVMPGDTKSSDK